MNEIVIRNADKVAIEISPSALAERDTVVRQSKEIVLIDASIQQGAVTILSRINGTLKALESSRKLVKAPVLELGRKIDAIADQFAIELTGEKTRISRLLSDFEEKQRREREEAERIRQENERKAREEQQRIEEERIRKEEEARREQERIEREFHEARQREEGAVKTPAQIAGHLERFTRKEGSEFVVVFHGLTHRAKSKDALLFQVEQAVEQEIKDARAHQERLAEESRQREIQRQKEQDRLAEEARIAEANRLAQLSAPAPVAPVKAKGSVTRDVWKFEVVDISKLHAHSPHLVALSPKTLEINRTISCGAREIPGLRIWKEVVVGARAS